MEKRNFVGESSRHRKIMQYRINVREKVGNFIRQKKMVAHIRSALIA